MVKKMKNPITILNSTKKQISWQELCNQNSHSEFKTLISSIEENLSISQINRVLQEIDSLADPKDVQKLREIQTIQEAKGGGFFGLIPPILPDDYIIPAPTDPEHIIEFLNFFANTQKQVLQYVPQSSFSLEFEEDPIKIFNFEGKSSYEPSPNFKIILELDLIEQILSLFNNPTRKNQLLPKILNNPIVHELIQHRNGLGYVPGPEFCPEFYSYHLENAIIDDPILNLWKMLHPWNFFDFADLWNHLEEYNQLYSTLRANKAQFENIISARLGNFIPPSMQLTERVAFSVEWAIRGWATSKYAGLNIEYMKNNYSEIIKTINHEVFHRIQVHLLPKPKSLISSQNDLSFDMLFDFTDLDPKEAKFYETLGYIFLEGTATYIGGDLPPSSTQNDYEKIIKGLNLLDEIMQKLYEQKTQSNDEFNFDEIDRLMGQGLISNGPFYSLGNYMTEHLVSLHGIKVIKDALKLGWYHFYSLYFKECDNNKELLQFPSVLRSFISKNEEIVVKFLNL